MNKDKIEKAAYLLAQGASRMRDCIGQSGDVHPDAIDSINEAACDACDALQLIAKLQHPGWRAVRVLVEEKRG